MSVKAIGVTMEIPRPVSAYNGIIIGKLVDNPQPTADIPIDKRPMRSRLRCRYFRLSMLMRSAVASETRDEAVLSCPVRLIGALKWCPISSRRTVMATPVG